MRIAILLVALLAAGAYYMFGGRTLDQEAIDAFYHKDTHATLSRDPDGLCNLLADAYQGQGTSVIQGQRISETHDKAQACAAYVEFYRSVAEIGSKLGGIAQIDYNHDIEDVSFSSDKKTATVTFTYSIDIAGRVMRVRGKAIDTLIRRHGQVLRLKSEDRSIITSG